MRQGSWLPMVGLVVDSVAFDHVNLINSDGLQVTLQFREESRDETGGE